MQVSTSWQLWAARVQSTPRLWPPGKTDSKIPSDSPTSKGFQPSTPQASSRVAAIVPRSKSVGGGGLSSPSLQLAVVAPRHATRHPSIHPRPQLDLMLGPTIVAVAAEVNEEGERQGVGQAAGVCVSDLVLGEGYCRALGIAQRNRASRCPMVCGWRKRCGLAQHAKALDAHRHFA